jgi:hypothetical protein
MIYLPVHNGHRIIKPEHFLAGNLNLVTLLTRNSSIDLSFFAIFRIIKNQFFTNERYRQVFIWNR